VENYEWFSFEYIFDFGDGYRFDLEFILTRKLRSDERVGWFPCLVDLRGVASKQYEGIGYL